MYIKLDREYEVKATLGTIRDIERAFGKGFLELAGGIAKMTLDEQLKLLYVGARKANPGLSEEAFNAACEEHLGLGDLMEYLEKYMYALQYPGLSEEEVRERLEKKLERSREMQQGPA
ncbi:MAG: hypothetical protein LBL66_10525 [Clostridiales bacterium]|jgi:hypothetical protein|nr:hypothetical protein [Clostridiales bacterium]